MSQTPGLSDDDHSQHDSPQSFHSCDTSKHQQSIRTPYMGGSDSTDEDESQPLTSSPQLFSGNLTLPGSRSYSLPPTQQPGPYRRPIQQYAQHHKTIVGLTHIRTIKYLSSPEVGVPLPVPQSHPAAQALREPGFVPLVEPLLSNASVDVTTIEGEVIPLSTLLERLQYATPEDTYNQFLKVSEQLRLSDDRHRVAYAQLHEFLNKNPSMQSVKQAQGQRFENNRIIRTIREIGAPCVNKRNTILEARKRALKAELMSEEFYEVILVNHTGGAYRFMEEFVKWGKTTEGPWTPLQSFAKVCTAYVVKRTGLRVFLGKTLHDQKKKYITAEDVRHAQKLDIDLANLKQKYANEIQAVMDAEHLAWDANGIFWKGGFPPDAYDQAVFANGSPRVDAAPSTQASTPASLQKIPPRPECLVGPIPPASDHPTWSASPHERRDDLLSEETSSQGENVSDIPVDSVETSIQNNVSPMESDSDANSRVLTRSQRKRTFSFEESLSNDGEDVQMTGTKSLNQRQMVIRNTTTRAFRKTVTDKTTKHVEQESPSVRAAKRPKTNNQQKVSGELRKSIDGDSSNLQPQPKVKSKPNTDPRLPSNASDTNNDTTNPAQPSPNLSAASKSMTLPRPMGPFIYMYDIKTSLKFEKDDLIVPDHPAPIANADKTQTAMWDLVKIRCNRLAKVEKVPLAVEPSDLELVLERKPSEIYKATEQISQALTEHVQSRVTHVYVEGLNDGMEVILRTNSIQQAATNRIQRAIAKFERHFSDGAQVLVGCGTHFKTQATKIGQRDIQKLLIDAGHNGWLNGTLVYAALLLLAADFNHHQIGSRGTRQHQDVQVISEYEWLVWQKDKKLPRNWPGTPRSLLILVLEGNHFVLLTCKVSLDGTTGTIHYYDSKYEPARKAKHVQLFKDIVAEDLDGPFGKIKISETQNGPPGPQQYHDYDCGMQVIQNAKAWLADTSCERCTTSENRAEIAEQIVNHAIENGNNADIIIRDGQESSQVTMEDCEEDITKHPRLPTPKP